MSRYVSNAGAFYAYLAQGLGRAWGVSASAVALVAYNTIQIGLYGLFGVLMQGLFEGQLGLWSWPWWLWALVGWVLVGILGMLRVDLNASVLGVLLILEVAAVIVFDVVALGNPAGGSISFDGFLPENLFTAGVGGVLAFGIAAFVGFESGTAYSEEVRDPRRTVARATYLALFITGVLYAISAWALTVGAGPDDVATRAAEDPGLPFTIMAEHVNTIVVDAANILFATSVFAALLSFHNAVARYVMALGRERVMPHMFGSKGVGSGAPIAGSLLQSVLALGFIAAFAVLERDPILELFTWLSYIAAVGVLLLMFGTSFAVIGFFRKRGPTLEGAWQRVVAPILAILALGAIISITVYNSDAVLGTAKNSMLVYVLPGIVGVAAVIGLLWGVILRSARPAVYEGIGRGVKEEDDEAQPQPLSGVGLR
jgi:amino acid transporter